MIKSNYPLNLLKTNKIEYSLKNEHLEMINQILIENNCRAQVVDHLVGPCISQYLVNVKFKKDFKVLQGLETILSEKIKCSHLRVEAPALGQNYAIIEICNFPRNLVCLGNLINNPEFLENEQPLLMALGIDQYQQAIYANLEDLPHVLLAGSTGSGKSVLINSMLISLLARNQIEDLRVVLIDPKEVELADYANIPTLAMPIVTDIHQAERVLQKLVDIMHQRFNLLEQAAVHNIKEYNKYASTKDLEKLPRIVIIIDELADLAWLPDTLQHLQILTTKARAVGIHLIVSTQRPAKEVVESVTLANIPARIALRMISEEDSLRVINRSGAQNLLGHGDMLYVVADKPKRLQGAYVSNSEIREIVNYLANQASVNYLEEFKSIIEEEEDGK